MNKPLHILMPTDVFPPKAGGAGWSSFALAEALQARGHTVQAFVPHKGLHGQQQRTQGTIPVVDVGYDYPRLPFVANYARFEQFWPQFGQVLIEALRNSPHERVIIHGQHIQGIGAAINAATQLRVPTIATVRDHWPWHYFATGLHADRIPVEYFDWKKTATDLIGRNNSFIGIISTLGVPYIQAHMQRRQKLLQHASAVIGVSPYIVQRLRPIVPQQRLHTIPNMVDLARIDQTIAQPIQIAVPDEYILFTGKLARNKGAYLLPTVIKTIRAHGIKPQIIILGGTNPDLITALESAGATVWAIEWADHDDVLRLMARCKVLVFPSTWGEPLSRVLLEACAVGAPIAAIPTGGTPDLLTHAKNALFATSAEQLGKHVVTLLQDRSLAEKLGRQARLLATLTLSSDHVINKIETLYYALRANYE